MDEIDAAAKATDASVTLRPVSTATGFLPRWKDWLARWDRFNASERSLANLLSPVLWAARSDDAAREAEARAAQLEELRAEYAALGGRLVGPSVPRIPVAPPVDWGSIVRWGAVGAAVLGGAALLLVYAPEIKLALRAGRRT